MLKVCLWPKADIDCRANLLLETGMTKWPAEIKPSGAAPEFANAGGMDVILHCRLTKHAAEWWREDVRNHQVTAKNPKSYHYERSVNAGKDTICDLDPTADALSMKSDISKR